MKFLQPRWRLVLAAALLHALVAGLAVSPVFFMPSVATARRVFGGSNAEKALFEDVRAYHEYASRILNGDVPYRDFDVEYPIGALPFFVIPRLIASELIPYRWAFAFEMLLFDAALVWLIAKRGDRTIGATRAVVWYSIGLGLLGGIPIARFDLSAVFFAFAAMMAWEANRGGIAGFLAGIGGLVKLFPIVIAAPQLVVFFRWGDRSSPSSSGRRAGTPAPLLMLVMGLTVFLGAGLWFLIGGAGVMKSLRYHSARGLEIESLYAGLLMTIAKLFGWTLAHDYNHSSVELMAPYAYFTAKIAPFVQLAAMGWVTFRMTRAEPGRRELAALLAFALFGKVLSPQYLLWILPFVATLEGRAGTLSRPWLMAACGLTTLLYFWAGVGLVQFHPLAIAILDLRNAILLGMFILLTRPTDQRL